MATYFLQYGLQMLNSLRNTSTTVYPCFSLFLGSHRLGILPFSLRAMSESKAHDQGHVVQFLWSLPRHRHPGRRAAPYWHEAHLDKRQEQSILRRYPVPDHGAVVGQGSAPKRTCTVPPDAWYCRAAQCAEMSPVKEHGPVFMCFPPTPALPARSTECPVSAAPRMQAIPVLSSHRGYSPRSFETSYGGSREAGKRRHMPAARIRGGSSGAAPRRSQVLSRKCTSQERGQRQRMRAGVDAQEAPALPAKRRGYPTRFPHCDGCVRESGSYPVEAQFQQSDGAWSVCARPRSGVRDVPRSTSCAPAATTPAQTSTWVGPVGPADGVAGPRGAEGYTHPYPTAVPSDGAFRVSTGSSTQRSGRVREVMTSGWTDRDSGAGGAELCGAGRGSASRGLQYGIGPPHFHPTTAHVPHGRRLPVEAKNSSSVIYLKCDVQLLGLDISRLYEDQSMQHTGSDHEDRIGSKALFIFCLGKILRLARKVWRLEENILTPQIQEQFAKDVVSAQPAVIASTSNIENSATITAVALPPLSTLVLFPPPVYQHRLFLDAGFNSPVPFFVGSLAGSVTGGSIAGSPYHMGSPYEFGASSFDAAAQLLKDTTHLALGFDNGMMGGDADATGEDESMADARSFATAPAA
ncbi:hypothetical protein B0H14DRAFT_3142331 [Mycena olivaceomarginata]|nr:hypothetical protein B0H14DRAFT_3142331 [Mycena olivaceomarginata]